MLEIGSLVDGKYKILNKIGQGGMSVVYLAMNERANKQWAIKEVRKDGVQNFEVVKQGLIAETEMLKKLSHPNLPSIIDVIDGDGTFLIVMDYIEGRHLESVVKEYGAQSQEDVIEWAKQLCDVLSYLHSRKPPIIYRDMKPSNVMLKPDGKVMLIDFGTAREFKENSVADTTCLGTQGYAAPEQYGGHGQTDARTDIYCLGATLYHLLTGHNPSEPPYEMYPIRYWNPELSSGLEEIILKCTQKNAERRYPNTDELIQDLKRSLVDPDGDFVVIPPLGNADTLIITDEELDEIQNSYDEDEYDEDEYDEDEYDEDEYDEDEYDEDEYDVDDGKRGKGSDEVNPKMKKLTRILTVVVAIIIAFIVIFAIGRAAGIFRIGPESPNETEDMVEVPNVVGMTEDDAKETLNDEGLGFKVVSREESKEYEKGRVSEQKTEAGEEVAKNTTIEVVVSSGLVGDSITVPDVSGMTEDEAQSALENAGFRNISSEFTYHDSVPSGQVIGTTPEANAEATEDTEIVMQVSKGAERKTVPNVVGQKDADAQNAIKSAGLSVGTVTYEYSDSVAQGIVISQSVDGGKKVSAGTTVDLVISNGPEPAAKVNVPPVTGTSESNARQLIQNAGLGVGTVTYQHSSSVAAGYVISCSPGVGSSVDEGTSVSLVVSTGPEQTNPDPGTGGDDGDGETD